MLTVRLPRNVPDARLLTRSVERPRSCIRIASPKWPGAGLAHRSVDSVNKFYTAGALCKALPNSQYGNGGGLRSSRFARSAVPIRNCQPPWQLARGIPEQARRNALRSQFGVPRLKRLGKTNPAALGTECFAPSSWPRRNAPRQLARGVPDQTRRTALRSHVEVPRPKRFWRTNPATLGTECFAPRA